MIIKKKDNIIIEETKELKKISSLLQEMIDCRNKQGRIIFARYIQEQIDNLVIKHQNQLDNMSKLTPKRR